MLTDTNNLQIYKKPQHVNRKLTTSADMHVFDLHVLFRVTICDKIRPFGFFDHHVNGFD